MNYPFTNPPLPYAYDALEPYIDTLTMHLHHDRHLQTYIDNLRKDYIADWFQVVHWSSANRIYEEFISFL